MDKSSILILTTENRADKIKKEYIDKIHLDPSNIKVGTLFVDKTRKKTKTSDIKEYLSSISEEISRYDYVLIADPEYFKVYSGSKNAVQSLGYLIPVGSQKVAYLPNYKAIFYDPVKTRANIDIAINALNKDLEGKYQDPGKDIIEYSCYPDTIEDIQEALEAIKLAPKLTCDIETYSLHVQDAGLASITFCWNEHKGIAFKIDDGKDKPNYMVRKFLKDFFMFYQGTLIFHNISFDATILIYNLFMEDIEDVQHLLLGLRTLLWNFEDTKLIAYLATNSCSGNELGLKALSREFAGNYAQEDIDDVTKIPLDQLLEYNLTDGLATWYVYNKYYPKMVEDSQLEIYEELFKPAVIDIVQMQLTGIPMDMNRVLEVEQILQHDQNTALDTIKNNKYVQQYVNILNERWVTQKNNKLKTKKVTLKDAHEEFNPRSPLHLKGLLYDFLELPILAKTATCQPSTDGDTINSLRNHTTDPDVLSILQGLLDYSAVDKILTAFIPAFKRAIRGRSGHYYLLGGFNLGGTVSGRLSSSKPNLQTIPSTGTKYAKLIKSCFKAPEGWLFCGLDFAALEDHISALTTKDPNKLKVYEQSFDGHCLRAFSYFGDQMPDITAEIEEVKKPGKVYKVELDDGSIKYLNENNPELKELLNASNKSN